MHHLSKLKVFDLMSTTIDFTIKGHAHIKTWFGFSFTILYIGIFFCLSWIIFESYLDTSNPIVFQATSESAEYPTIDLLSSQILPTILVFKEGSIPVPADQVYRYFTPIFYKMKYKTTQNPDGTSQFTLDTLNMNMLPCSQVLANQSVSSYYYLYKKNIPPITDFQKNQGICLEPNIEEMSVQSNSSGKTDIFHLDVLPCMLPAGCATPAELRALSIVFIQPKVSLNLSNYEKPTEINLSMDRIFTFGENIYQILTYELATTQIKDTSDFLSKSKHRDSKTIMANPGIALTSRDANQLQCTAAEVFTRACVPYLTFRFLSSPSTTVVTRTYKGIIKVFSEIGGISSIILAICLQLCQIYVYFRKNKILVHEVFGFLGSKSFERCVAAEVAKKYAKQDSSEVNLINYDPTKDDKVAVETRKRINSIQGDALRLIKNNLDIVTIIREMNNIRFLVETLLKEDQRDLIPLYCINKAKRDDCLIGKKYCCL